MSDRRFARLVCGSTIPVFVSSLHHLNDTQILLLALIVVTLLQALAPNPDR